jgi:hypothetical protein
MSDSSEYLRILASAEAKTESASWPAAAALWARVVALNPVVGRYWASLAEARYEAEDFRGALDAWAQAERNGVWIRNRELETIYPAEIPYRMATCHVRFGDHAAAVSELRRAVGLGLRDLDRPKEDKHWQPLLEDETVRDLLGIVDVAGMSRDEGWRTDLRFLAREIKRRAYAPFAVVPESDFDAAVARLGEEVPRLSDLQIIAEMMKLLVPLGDGHAFIIPDQENEATQLGLPVKFYAFTEGVFVTAATDAHRDLLGAQVLRFGQRGVDEVLAAIEPLKSRDNAQQVKWIGPELLRWTPLMHAVGMLDDPGRAELTVRLADQSVTTVSVDSVAVGPHDYPTVAPPPRPTRPRPEGWVSLPDTIAAPMPLYLRNCDVAYWFTYLPGDGTVYFQFNGVGDQPSEPIAEFSERLFAFVEDHEVSRLIIDLRWNGGGNTYLVQPLLHRLIGCTKINRWGSLYVIIGRGTFSAAQNTATAIERETNAIFVGEPSGSRPNFIGETIPFKLPYSKARVNVADLFWQTSWPMDHRPWIGPDLYAPPSFETYSQNRDPAMEAILSAGEHLPGC